MQNLYVGMCACMYVWVYKVLRAFIRFLKESLIQKEALKSSTALKKSLPSQKINKQTNKDIT